MGVLDRHRASSTGSHDPTLDPELADLILAGGRPFAARPAPPRPPIGASASSSRPAGAHAGRRRAAAPLTQRELVVVAGAVVAFLACLVIVLMTAHVAAADVRPLPEAPRVRVRADPPLSSGHPLVTLPWGTAAGAVGLDPAGEGLRRAPWALAVAPDGRIAVLDAVNHRVVTLDAAGGYAGDIPLDLTDPRFLAVDDRLIHVLDPDEDRRLVTVEWSGAVLSSLTLPPLDEPVSALLSRDGAAFIETAHDTVFAVSADPEQGPPPPGPAAEGRSERPAQLQPAAGRPLPAAGQAGGIRCGFEPPESARLCLTGAPTPAGSAASATVAGPASQSAVVPVSFPWTIEHLVSLDVDRRGNVVLGARLLEPLTPGRPSTDDAAPTGTDRSASLVVTRLPSTVWGTGAHAASPGPAAPCLLLEDGGAVETGAPYAVAPDGSIFQPRADEVGYTILVHRFPEE